MDKQFGVERGKLEYVQDILDMGPDHMIPSVNQFEFQGIIRHYLQSHFMVICDVDVVHVMIVIMIKK